MYLLVENPHSVVIGECIKTHFCSALSGGKSSDVHQMEATSDLHKWAV